VTILYIGASTTTVQFFVYFFWFFFFVDIAIYMPVARVFTFSKAQLKINLKVAIKIRVAVF
jgi:low affinity Fe/Cu permease